MTETATGLRPGTWGIGTYRAQQAAFPGVVLPDGGVIDISDRYADTHAVFDDWDRAYELLGDLAATATPALRFEELHALPPLAHPNMLCAGANYKTHSAQMLTKNKFNQHNRLEGESDDDFFARNYQLMEERSRTGTPFVWTGLHSSLVGANDDVVLPLIGEQPDWELELGVVLGRRGRYVADDEARAMVAGYVMVNDLGTVDIFRRTDVPWGYDWISKHQPSFKPAGPFIVPAAFVDIDSVQIQLNVNGDEMQNWPANDMIFDVGQMITYLSERVNLTPGDLLIMGSPPGNGAHHGRFLRDGDVIDSTISGLGHQRNRCVAEDAQGRVPRYPAFGE